MSVVSLEDRRKQKEEATAHASGGARCLACKHEWVAVSPVPADQPFECPSCGAMKGLYTQLLSRNEHDHFTCNCGCNFFHITRTGIYCPCCGGWQDPF